MIVYCFPQGTVVSRVSVYHFVSYNAGYNKSITAHLGSLGKKDPCEESDTTERLHFHFSLSRIGEGKGNPLQCSCLENPRDGGAWWAAVSGVAQSWTRLKWLGSSSSSIHDTHFSPSLSVSKYTLSLEFCLLGSIQIRPHLSVPLALQFLIWITTTASLVISFPLILISLSCFSHWSNLETSVYT